MAGKDRSVSSGFHGKNKKHLNFCLTRTVRMEDFPLMVKRYCLPGRGLNGGEKVYATWSKPIVVLCNQNSFSNAEIFSHAVKTLKRGKLVGVPTAGGVISTGGTNILDIGFLRMPFRGWYISGTGKDMELNGAVPHHIIWNKPHDVEKGKDGQLTKAIRVLLQDVKKQKLKPEPELRKASEMK